MMAVSALCTDWVMEDVVSVSDVTLAHIIPILSRDPGIN